MSARLLLVTGSRVLAAADYEQRACALLAAHAEHYAPTIVVCGDADGPDSWAASWAVAHAIDLRIYALDGWVHSAGKLLRPWSKEPRDAATFCKPLDRNAAMVRETAAQRERGAHVEAVALEASWSATHGTQHTIGLLRGQRVEITRITFERGNLVAN